MCSIVYMHFTGFTYGFDDDGPEPKSLKVVSVLVQVLILQVAQSTCLKGQHGANSVHFRQHHVTAEFRMHDKKLAVERNVDVHKEILEPRSVVSQEQEPPGAR
jgi:hypothetical protein